jgi:hypothetical protein
MADRPSIRTSISMRTLVVRVHSLIDSTLAHSG